MFYLHVQCPVVFFIKRARAARKRLDVSCCCMLLRLFCFRLLVIRIRVADISPFLFFPPDMSDCFSFRSTSRLSREKISKLSKVFICPICQVVNVLNVLNVLKVVNVVKIYQIYQITDQMLAKKLTVLKLMSTNVGQIILEETVKCCEHCANILP